VLRQGLEPIEFLVRQQRSRYKTAMNSAMMTLMAMMGKVVCGEKIFACIRKNECKSIFD